MNFVEWKIDVNMNMIMFVVNTEINCYYKLLVWERAKNTTCHFLPANCFKRRDMTLIPKGLNFVCEYFLLKISLIIHFSLMM